MRSSTQKFLFFLSHVCSQLVAIKSNSISTGSQSTVHMELLLHVMTPFRLSEDSFCFKTVVSVYDSED